VGHRNKGPNGFAKVYKLFLWHFETIEEIGRAEPHVKLRDKTYAKLAGSNGVFSKPNPSLSPPPKVLQGKTHK